MFRLYFEHADSNADFQDRWDWTPLIWDLLTTQSTHSPVRVHMMMRPIAYKPGDTYTVYIIYILQEFHGIRIENQAPCSSSKMIYLFVVKPKLFGKTPHTKQQKCEIQEYKVVCTGLFKKHRIRAGFVKCCRWRKMCE